MSMSGSVFLSKQAALVKSIVWMFSGNTSVICLAGFAGVYRL